MTHTKGKIMLVEDDQFQIDMYTTKFTQGGYEVVAVSEPKDAVLTAAKEQPDIILLDLIIGWAFPLTEENTLKHKAEDLEGIKILRELKKNPETKDLLVVIFTNLDKNYLRQSGARWGSVEYIIKASMVPSEVLKKVEELIKEHRQR